MTGPNARAFVQAVVGAEVLREARAALPGHIDLVVLKGVWLQHAVYSDAAERPVTDVDVLVREADYGPVLTRLQGCGWRVAGGSRYETALRCPGYPLALDVHRRLFADGAFKLREHEVLARANPAIIGGSPVLFPDPLDGLAHIIGHLVKSRGHDLGMYCRDIERIVLKYELDAEEAVRFLVKVGMARAARFAFDAGMSVPGSSGFCARALSALPSDPVGGALVRALRWPASGPRLAASPRILGFALESSLWRAAGSALVRVRDRLVDP